MSGVSPVVALLDTLVRARSPSREEHPAADALEAWLRANAPGDVVRADRNVAIVRDSGVPGPTLLLLSHHDTVPATAAWTRDPWSPTIEGGRMYGLGANDAKGCLAAMCVAFAGADVRRGRLVLAGVCEEEIGAAARRSSSRRCRPRTRPSWASPRASRSPWPRTGC